MPLTYDRKAAIARDVILGLDPPKGEKGEAAEYRAAIKKDKAAADKAGLMLDLPFEWDENEPRSKAVKSATPIQHD